MSSSRLAGALPASEAQLQAACCAGLSAPLLRSEQTTRRRLSCAITQQGVCALLASLAATPVLLQAECVQDTLEAHGNPADWPNTKLSEFQRFGKCFDFK